MDFTTASNDDLANATKALIDELESRQALLIEGAFKTRAGRLLAIIHTALNDLRDGAADNGTIHPDSGGSSKGD